MPTSNTQPSSDPALLSQLRALVGARHVLTRAAAKQSYCAGYRSGSGEALAVLRPGSLTQLWLAAQACCAAGKILIVQAANTGLTGGSTPNGAYDRDVVVISTRRIRGLHMIDGGRQVVCLPGTTLYRLERSLRPMGREPHSVIGSSCIGASVIGGICNNSGGSLVRRGPAFTELALFARIDAEGRLRLVNHLGIDLGGTPEEILDRLDRGDFSAADIQAASDHRASDRDYERHVRAIDEGTPARFNTDPRRLFEASGCAGKLIVLAVRLDTYASAGDSRLFYVGANDPAELTALRRDILGGFRTLPVSAEYMHRDAFAIAERYGRDMFLAIRLLGADRLPLLYRVKSWLDGLAGRLNLRAGFADRLLQRIGERLPQHLPSRIVAFRDRFEHHLLLKVDGDGIDEARDHLARVFATGGGDYFECDRAEAEKASLHRFVAAGAAVRYRAVHPDEVEDLVALDVALRRDDRDWVEELPTALEAQILHKLYYGHFLCHVFHQDYVVRKGCDPDALEHAMWNLLDARGAEYPAEHNVGHIYRAKPALSEFYRAIDPTNTLNPGLGQTSRNRDWR